MWQKVGKGIGFALLWVLIIVVVISAERLATKHNKSVPVTTIEIDIEGGGDNPLIDQTSLLEWFGQHGITPIGSVIDNVDIATIEQTIAHHNAVAEANVFVTYDGEMEVEITQREPIARLRIAGYDMYLTREGYLLPAKDVYAVHVPVITGSFKPLFKSDFIGYAKDVALDSIAMLDKHIATLEDDKLPLYRDLIANNKQLRSVKRAAPKKSIFVSKGEFDILYSAYKEGLSKATEDYSINKRRINGAIAALGQAQEDARKKQHTIRNHATDFEALVELLAFIGEDEFWNAEIVQIIATGGGHEPLQLAIIPRSGRFTVDLGTMENLVEKLNKLRRFYENGLNNVGWDKYRNISLRYRGQVVCR